jgi:hypothetical protein
MAEPLRDRRRPVIMAGDRICYLHVGTGKTGSSAIQYALTRAHDYLLGHGYLYPDLSENFRNVLNLRPTAGNGVNIIRVMRARGRLADVVRPLAGTPHNAILSCEGFSNHPARLLEELGATLRSLGFSTKCLVFFRPQHEMIASSYLQMVKSAKVDAAVELSDFARRRLGAEATDGRWNWHARVGKLHEAFGNVTVKWYPAVRRLGPNGVVDATFAWLGLPPPRDGFASDGVIVNPTPGREALIVLRSINAEGRGSKRFADRFLAKAEEAGLLGGKVMLDRATMEAVHMATRESNAALIEQYCPELSVEEELTLPPLDADGPIDGGKLRELEKMAAAILSRTADRGGFRDSRPSAAYSSQ